MLYRQRVIKSEQTPVVVDSASLGDLLTTLLEADKRHSSTSRTRKLGDRLAPLLDFLDRYAGSIDSIVQGVGGNGINPACVAWGILKGVIEVYPETLRVVHSHHLRASGGICHDSILSQSHRPT